MDLERFRRLPLMGILRGISRGQLGPLLDTVEASGLETIEITMNTEGAPDLIQAAVAQSGNRLMIGAGTVLTVQDLESALRFGATFIVMPVVVKAVMAYCVKRKIPVFPGALCPQDIYEAWSQGATMVKVFPAKVFGPEYLSEIKGPFHNIELLACAGVAPENLKSYFAHGASAIAIGSSVFRKNWLESGDYERMGSRIKEYIQAFREISES